MDTREIIVVIVGVAAIAFVLWYFFGPRKAVAATADAAGVQEVKVTVKGGYSPDLIVVKQGRPVRLDFYRDESSGCSESLRIPEFGVARDLPPFTTTSVDLTPTTPGEFTFTCGMNMLRGRLVVEPA
jgi:plastocyanin domain-containing protein